MTDIDYSATQEEFEQITAGVLDYMTRHRMSAKETWIEFKKGDKTVTVERNGVSIGSENRLFVVNSGGVFDVFTAKKANTRIRKELGLGKEE